MTHEEWAAKLIEDGVLTTAHLAIVLRHAEERGARRERDACSSLAREHAHTITEVEVAQTPLGRKLDWQQQIDVAASMRHVAQYVGVLISNRTPAPPKPLDLP